jgi:hypothetical protein
MKPVYISNIATYLKAHWHGRLPLPLSFWINLAVVQKLSSVLLLYLIKNSSLSIVLVATVISLFIGIWSLVGSWRSAAAYANTHTQLWGHLVHLVIVLSVLGILISIIAISKAKMY